MDKEANTSPTVPTKLTGWRRVVKAAGYSLAGLAAGWREPAFRQEAILAFVLVPAAFWLGQSWIETVLLLTVTLLVLVTELLNTAVEAVVDRIGPEWHEQSKRAKDIGSAAVLLTLLLCGGVWLSALWRWMAIWV
jgi:diacylglycerol kinase (ATP)